MPLQHFKLFLFPFSLTILKTEACHDMPLYFPTFKCKNELFNHHHISVTVSTTCPVFYKCKMLKTIVKLFFLKAATDASVQIVSSRLWPDCSTEAALVSNDTYLLPLAEIMQNIKMSYYHADDTQTYICFTK